jgi:hypothetical protein
MKLVKFLFHCHLKDISPFSSFLRKDTLMKVKVLKLGHSARECEIPAGSTVQDALDNAAPGGRLVVTVVGACAENIFIERDRVTIQGQSAQDRGTLAGVAPSVGNEGFESVVNVDGARGIRIQFMNIQGFAGQGGNHGVLVSDNGSVTIDDSTIENNARHGVFLVESSNVDLFGGSVVQNNGEDGVLVFENSHFDAVGATIQNNGGSGVAAVISSSATFDTSTVSGNAQCGVFVGEASSGRMFNGNTISSGNSILCSSSGCAAVSVYRSSSFRINGNDNVITNTASGQDTPSLCNAGGFAIDTEMTSSFRINGSNTIVNGHIESFNLSTVDIRAGTVNGQIYSDGLDTNVRLGGRDFQTTVNGTMYPITRMTFRDNGLLLLNGNVDGTNGCQANTGFTNFGTGFGYVNGC